MITLEQLAASPAAKPCSRIYQASTKLWPGGILIHQCVRQHLAWSCTSLGCWLPVEENLNYSAKGFDGRHGLPRFPSLASHCLAYERRPEKIKPTKCTPTVWVAVTKRLVMVEAPWSWL
jgi:hypothetical protein